MRKVRKNMKIKLWKKAVAIGLIAIMATVSPAKVLADNPEVEYVKEFTLASGKDMKEAKKILTDAGYKVKEEDICKEAYDKVVLLGYKTTKNKDEAVTDVKALREEGAFSSTNLQKSLENQSNEIKKLIAQWKPAIQEFQKNYGDGTDLTIPVELAKMALDTLYEDDSKKLMGDFLLDLDLDKEKDVEALTSVLLQGNSAAIASIQDALTTSCAELQTAEESTGPCNWIERYCEYSMAKDFDNKYANEAASLHDFSATVKKSIDTYFETMKLPEVGGKSKGYNAYVEKLKKEGTKESQEKASELIAAKEVYDTLHGNKCRILREENGKATYLDMDMTEFFQRDDLCDKDFYPMAKALTLGQKSMLIYVGLVELVCLEGKTAAKWKKMKKEAEEKIEQEYEGKKEAYVSIYQGVNRKMFDQDLIKDGHIALTKNASEYCDLTGDCSWAGSTGNSLSDKPLLLGSIVCFGVFIGTAVITAVIQLSRSWLQPVAGAFKIAQNIGKCLLLIGAIAVVAGVILVTISGETEDNHKEKPQIIVDERLLEMKSKECARIKGYISYDAIKSPSGEITECTRTKATEWVCLYQTKYSLAGDPITTDFVISGEMISDSKYKGVSFFEDVDGCADINLAYGDQINEPEHCYMYVQKKVLDFGDASETGSAFASGTNLIFGGAGLIVGAVGFGLLSGRGRRKKEVA